LETDRAKALSNPSDVSTRAIGISGGGGQPMNILLDGNLNGALGTRFLAILYPAYKAEKL
jgi:hypothetical protein